MPFYFDTHRSFTTNGTTQTRSAHLRALTVANQRVCRISQVIGSLRHNSAGGAIIRVETGSGSAASGGTSYTPGKRTAASPAASTTWLTDASAITSNTTLTVREHFGMAQTGGTGGWTAIEPDDAIQLEPNGGTNGNAEVSSLAVGTSLTGDVTVEFSE